MPDHAAVLVAAALSIMYGSCGPPRDELFDFVVIGLGQKNEKIRMIAVEAMVEIATERDGVKHSRTDRGIVVYRAKSVNLVGDVLCRSAVHDQVIAAAIILGNAKGIQVGYDRELTGIEIDTTIGER
jgi:hypothetical protein